MCLKLGVPEIGNMASKIGDDQLIIDKITLKTDNGRPKTINGEPETAHNWHCVSETGNDAPKT